MSSLITASLVVLAGGLLGGVPSAAPAAVAPSSSSSTTSTTTEAASLPPAPDMHDDVTTGVVPIAVTSGLGTRVADIPQVALASYQRAQSIMDAADASCHLDWALLAAIGQVVSGHGTGDGQRLRDDGVVAPAVVGRPVRDADGRRLADSDRGRLDGDQKHDRAVGPMSLPPATWAVVGVDGDSDGRRNPHDLDDAALGVAVLLCSGKGDLRTGAGAQTALARLSTSEKFIEAVLLTARGYRADRSTPAVPAIGEPPAVIPISTGPSPSEPTPTTEATFHALEQNENGGGSFPDWVSDTPGPTLQPSPSAPDDLEPDECESDVPIEEPADEASQAPAIGIEEPDPACPEPEETDGPEPALTEPSEATPSGDAPTP